MTELENFEFKEIHGKKVKKIHKKYLKTTKSYILDQKYQQHQPKTFDNNFMYLQYLMDFYSFTQRFLIEVVWFTYSYILKSNFDLTSLFCKFAA